MESAGVMMPGGEKKRKEETEVDTSESQIQLGYCKGGLG